MKVALIPGAAIVYFRKGSELCARQIDGNKKKIRVESKDTIGAWTLQGVILILAGRGKSSSEVKSKKSQDKEGKQEDQETYSVHIQLSFYQSCLTQVRDEFAGSTIDNSCDTSNSKDMM